MRKKKEETKGKGEKKRKYKGGGLRVGGERKK
jgi:hypothetical protein